MSNSYIVHLVVTTDRPIEEKTLRTSVEECLSNIKLAPANDEEGGWVLCEHSKVLYVKERPLWPT